MANVLTRQEVYDLIDGERDYQEALPRNTVRDQRPLEQMAHIEHLLGEMRADFYNKPGPVSMDYVRKIAAVAVRCMEEHGAPPRLGAETKP